MLLVIVPVGVVWGLIEAARFHPALAFLMFLLLSVISMFIGLTVRRIRVERAAGQSSGPPPNS